MNLAVIFHYHILLVIKYLIKSVIITTDYERILEYRSVFVKYMYMYLHFQDDAVSSIIGEFLQKIESQQRNLGKSRFWNVIILEF